MHLPRAYSSQRPTGKDLTFATGRAVRSIAVIVGVAWIIFAVRDGTFAWSLATHLILKNRTLFIMVFFALGIWEFWLQRAKRHHSAPGIH